MKAQERRASAYRNGMVSLNRVARALLLLVIATLAVWSIVAIASPDTGAFEKAVLVALVGSCLILAAKFSSGPTRGRERR
jgi:peptidoglycan/LPS O-acetylase OafA/YrhL